MTRRSVIRRNDANPRTHRLSSAVLFLLVALRTKERFQPPMNADGTPFREKRVGSQLRFFIKLVTPDVHQGFIQWEQ
jgi:hypothetical protein